MQRRQQNKIGKIKIPQNAQDFIVGLYEEFSEGNFIFRGNSEIFSENDDHINSSLCRWVKKKKAINKYHKPPAIEEEIVKKAKRLFPDKTSNIEILTDIRHYGGKVNLIDFTRDLHIALFFACTGDKFDKDGEIIALNTNTLEQLTEINYKKLSAKLNGKVGIIEPAQTQASKTRVVAQKSVFAYTEDEYIKEFQSKKIPHDLKDDILNHIKKFNNISHDTVYNDLIGFIQNEANYDTAMGLFYQGNAKFASGNHPGATLDYSKAIEINPQFAPAYNNRGNSKSALGDHPGAILDYDKAIEINPQDAPAYNNRGSAKSELSNHRKAILDYDKAIEINPQFTPTYYNRGNAKVALGNHREAILDYDKAIEINPQYAKAYYNRGNAKFALKDYHGAIQDYDKAIEINPQFAEAYNNRGSAKVALGKYSEAIQDYDKAIEINPQFAEAYNNRGSVKVALGNHPGAILDYDKAIEINPQDAKAYYSRGDTKDSLKDYQGAINDYTKAGELEKNLASMVAKAIDKAKKFL